LYRLLGIRLEIQIVDCGANEVGYLFDTFWIGLDMEVGNLLAWLKSRGIFKRCWFVEFIEWIFLLGFSWLLSNGVP
jgi:hypothetical protein